MLAVPIASRSDPAPESALVVTVNVAALAGSVANAKDTTNQIDVVLISTPFKNHGEPFRVKTPAKTVILWCL